jgi:CheY-like chemotaxis protein
MVMGHVLVVEDDPSVAGIVQAALELEGYDVDTAPNGREALTQVEQRPDLPLVVITDLLMPVMDGWEFIRTFRQRWGCEVPVVVMSATYRQPLPDDDGQVTAVLRKPFDLDTLLNTVGELAASAPRDVRRVQPIDNAVKALNPIRGGVRRSVNLRFLRRDKRPGGRQQSVA